MRIKGLAISALAAAVLAACASQQSADDKAMEATAKPAAKPAAESAEVKATKQKLMTGASTAMLANTCAGCHGTDGSSVGPAPTIAGLEEEYFVDVMKQYKSGERWSTIMDRIAKGYTDEEIEAIASYYGKMSFPRRTQTSVGPLARAGAKLHEKYCEKCHENEGREPEDIVLAGQWMPYLHWTMEDYAEGRSKYVEKKMAKAFKKMLDKHGDKSLLQLTHFYGSRE